MGTQSASFVPSLLAGRWRVVDVDGCGRGKVEDGWEAVNIVMGFGSVRWVVDWAGHPKSRVFSLSSVLDHTVVNMGVGGVEV